MKKAALIISVILISFNAFSDEVYRCDTDTLKLAYWYEDVYYDNNCDLQYADTLYLGSNSDVCVYIDTIIGLAQTYWFKHDSLNCSENHVVDDTIVNINTSGIFYVGFFKANQGTIIFSEITVIRMDSILVANPLISGFNENEIEYGVSVPDVFESYLWSTGDIGYQVIITEPGEYTIDVESYCQENFATFLSFDSVDFAPDQFHAGQVTGDNVIYYDFEPDIEPISLKSESWGLDTIFDLNMDNTDDIHLFLYGGTGQSYGYSSFLVSTINGSSISVLHDYFAADLAYKRLINDKMEWKDSENIVLNIYDDSYMDDNPFCEYGFWDNDETKYLAVKLSDGYAWVRISTDMINSWDTRIYDYAFIKTSTSINENTSETIRVYPNPASDFIQIDSQYDDLNIRIYDVLGNCVYQDDLTYKSSRLFLPDLQSGLYMLHVSNSDMNKTFKIVKQ